MAAEKRANIPETTLLSVLLSCRRRCCLCVWLDGDKSTKRGQIAHIDHDRSNPKEENLAFLCLSHHDEYDSTTRQSRKLTEGEVREYRNRLHRLIASGEDASPVTIAVPAQEVRGARPIRAPLGYQEQHLQLVLDRMRGEGRSEFDLYEFETFLVRLSRDGVDPLYHPMTISGTREAIEVFIREGRLQLTENAVILPPMPT